MDAISNALKEEYNSCTMGGLSTSECAGLISYSFVGGAFLKTLKVAGYLEDAGDLARLVDKTSDVTDFPRINSANKIDPYHNFPEIIDNYAVDAQKFSIPTKGLDGNVERFSDLYQIEGSLNGADGVFEWIVDSGNVTHRRFIPDGTITGTPNQIPTPLP